MTKGLSGYLRRTAKFFLHGFQEYWDAIIALNLCILTPIFTINASETARYGFYFAIICICMKVFFRRFSPFFQANTHFIQAQLGLRPSRANPRYITALFDEYADEFDEHLLVKLKYNGPNQLLDIVAPYIGTEQLLVVDLGCGTGLCGPIFRPFARDIIGVDLSPAMLSYAEKKNCYGLLIENDILDFLSGQYQTIDLCLAADVLVYFGDLNTVFQLVMKALHPSGHFVFSTERADQQGQKLTKTGRYEHSDDYVRACADTNGLTVIKWRNVILRHQIEAPVKSTVWLLRACG